MRRSGGCVFFPAWLMDSIKVSDTLQVSSSRLGLENLPCGVISILDQFDRGLCFVIDDAIGGHEVFGGDDLHPHMSVLE